MINKLLTLPMIGLLSFTAANYDLPKGWIRMGSEPKSFEMGIDPASGPDGNNAATIKSFKSKIYGFGTLMQVSRAQEYLGKRIKMSGMMKTKDVKDWAAFWLRVDGLSSDETTLTFDNMKVGNSDRSIKGTTSWTNYEIILDVPSNASTLNYGALLTGTGQIWFDKIKFEVVPDSVPMTGVVYNGPKGWTKMGNNVSEYIMSKDSGAGPAGSNAMTLRSVKSKTKGYGAMSQSILADKYKGQRVRMSTHLKTKGVKKWAGIWVRIDQKEVMADGQDMKDQVDWKKYEVVFEVPLDAKLIAYGAQLGGSGQIWIDDIVFEIVDESVPLTQGVKKIFLPEKEPLNLDFEIKND